ncbi:MAG: hypothetical protein RQ745_12005 [Longimicrobiales bacterium]|nr:hypothetical protein [Longimicrobiales bacterium]
MPSRRDRFREIAAASREKTNRELSDEIAGLTRLTADEVGKLLPTKAEKERLARLMEIVSASTARNTKVAQLRENFEELGAVAVKLLDFVL